jgi:lipopolysaccharide export system permease protein
MVILLPVSLLLALLFALGRMSRSNEIVSMLTAGVSVPRVVVPLLIISLLTTGVTLALNYSLAAHAELARKNFFDQVNRGGQRRDYLRTGFSQPDRQSYLVHLAFAAELE